MDPKASVLPTTPQRLLVLIQTHPDKTPSINAIIYSFAAVTTLFTSSLVMLVYHGLLFIAHPCLSRVSV